MKTKNNNQVRAGAGDGGPGLDVRSSTSPSHPDIIKEVKLTININYDYPDNGEYADTIAILADGRRMDVNIQYGRVYPLGKHAEGCAQTTRIGGICDCGLLDGLDVRELVMDARTRGLFGERP